MNKTVEITRGNSVAICLWIPRACNGNNSNYNNNNDSGDNNNNIASVSSVNGPGEPYSKEVRVRMGVPQCATADLLWLIMTEVRISFCNTLTRLV